MKSEVSPKQLKEFGLLVGLGFPTIIGFILPVITGHKFREWTIFIGFFLLVLSFLRPNLLFYPYKAWMSLGHYLGWINSRIILGMIFLLVVIPISFIMKLFNYDPLKKRKIDVVTYKEIKKNYKIDLRRIF